MNKDSNYIEYIGDGLYADFEYNQVLLIASNGSNDTNTVFLEPEVLQSFIRWLKRHDLLETSK